MVMYLDETRVRVLLRLNVVSFYLDNAAPRFRRIWR